MVVSCQIYFPLVKYTLYLISSHSWYFMELSPSAVALTFNPWPLNIYQLLKWLCTIIPSSVSQIHHSDHSGQLQVTCTVLTNAGTGHGILLFHKQLHETKLKALVSTDHSWKKGLAVKDTWGACGTGEVEQICCFGGFWIAYWAWWGALEPMHETQAWKDAFGNVKLFFVWVA